MMRPPRCAAHSYFNPPIDGPMWEQLLGRCREIETNDDSTAAIPHDERTRRTPDRRSRPTCTPEPRGVETRRAAGWHHRVGKRRRAGSEERDAAPRIRPIQIIKADTFIIRRV